LPCKGVCERYAAMSKTYDPDNEIKRCTLCMLFVRWEGKRCPCCSTILRIGPRSNKYRQMRVELEARI